MGNQQPQSAACRFPGGLKERTARDQFRLQPEEILRRAVYGMLPKNKLRKVGLGVILVSLRPSCTAWLTPEA